jgi:hypothetical protein
MSHLNLFCLNLVAGAGLGSGYPALSHMDVTYAGNAGANAGRPGGRRQFAMHRDVPVRRSGERPPGELANLLYGSSSAPIFNAKKSASQRGERRFFLHWKLVAGAGFEPTTFGL